MPLEILILLVVGGIAGIATLTWMTGLSKPRALSKGEAAAEWLRHYPDDTVTSARITHDGRAALIVTEQGSGLLWSMGADTVGRHLLDFDLVDEPHGLSVMFHDYTAPRVHLHLDEEERAEWARLMSPQ